MKTIAAILASVALAGCVHDQPPYSGPVETFDQYYTKLPKKEKDIAGYGYTYGRTQAAQEFDAAYRNMQSRSDAPAGQGLKKSVVALPTKKYTDAYGVQHDAGYIFVEKVNFVDIRKSYGRTLFIVK